MAQIIQHIEAVTLPESVLHLIETRTSRNPQHALADTLTAIAENVVRTHEHPTRLAFNSVTEVLSAAREQGLSDSEITSFLTELEKLLNLH